MRAEAISWDDWSVSNAPPVIDGDKWHVALAPGDVKVVSLEQLDDLFRLSIVDAETKVWQDGMSEWQPLRIIAGLDEPAPEPKRTYPKPPSPRSAPPPPRPKSVAPSPASFYPEGIALAATQPAFVTPIAVQQLASVRPLLVTSAPQRAARGAGGFGRFLVGLGLIAGVAISLYRNDVVRQAAHSAHQDTLYARLESALGGPAFGTLRAVEQNNVTATLAAALPAGSEDSASRAEPTSAPTPAPERQPAALLPRTAAPPVVSLESLAPEKAGAVRSKPEAAAVVPVSITPAATPKNVALVKPAVNVSAAAKPAAVEKPQAAPEKPAAQMTERERLNAAIGQAMLTSPSKASKSSSKSKSNEYDPLNPKL
jgi:hypothetical protein